MTADASADAVGEGGDDEPNVVVPVKTSLLNTFEGCGDIRKLFSAVAVAEKAVEATPRYSLRMAVEAVETVTEDAT